MKGDTTIIFSRNPAYPVKRPEEAYQVYGETEGGQLFVYSKGARIIRHELNFRGLPEADITALRSFVENEINFGLESFTYYDEDGIPHAVRLERPHLDFQEDFLGTFSGRLILREER